MTENSYKLEKEGKGDERIIYRYDDPLLIPQYSLAENQIDHVPETSMIVHLKYQSTTKNKKVHKKSPFRFFFFFVRFA